MYIFISTVLLDVNARSEAEALEIHCSVVFLVPSKGSMQNPGTAWIFQAYFINSIYSHIFCDSRIKCQHVKFREIALSGFTGFRLNLVMFTLCQKL